MPIVLSLYLDLIRFFASLGVLFEHISSKLITSDIFWWRLGNYGSISVIVFFVLSGYVIAYVSSSRESDLGAYFYSRISRLYSVVLPALILTFAFDSFGMFINPDFYNIKTILWRPESWSGYISSLFFVNEYQIFNFGGISPGTNGPYWSLSFEATYYLIAGIVIFFPRKMAIPTAIVILLIAGRTIAALLPVWMLGYYLYKYSCRAKINIFFAAAGFLLSLLALALFPSIEGQLPNDNFGLFFPWGRAAYNRNISADYMVAVLFGIHVLSAQSIARRINPPAYCFSAGIRWLGGLTFPLYCIHYPALCFFRAISPWGIGTWRNASFLLVSISVITILMSYFCEYLKNIIRNALLRL